MARVLEEIMFLCPFIVDFKHTMRLATIEITYN